jgi:hypothetical protein
MVTIHYGATDSSFVFTGPGRLMRKLIEFSTGAPGTLVVAGRAAAESRRSLLDSSPAAIHCSASGTPRS